MSDTTHSFNVSFPLPFFIPPITSKFRHLETQSLSSLRSTCPNHLNLPRLTTLSTPSIHNPCLSSLLVLLSFRVTPDIHLTILFSDLTSLCISSAFIAKFHCHTQAPSVHTLYISFPSLSKELTKEMACSNDNIAAELLQGMGGEKEIEIMTSSVSKIYKSVYIPEDF